MTHRFHGAVRLVAFALALAGCSSDDEKAGGAGGTSGSAGSGGSGGVSGSAGSGGSGGASGSAGSGASGMSGTGGSSSVEAGLDAGECNDLENTGQPVQPMQIPEVVPAGGGGALPPPGAYALELTAVNIYTGVGGPSGPAGDPMRWVAEAHIDSPTQNSIVAQGVQSVGTAPDFRNTTEFDRAAKLATQTCPAPASTFPFDYTFEDTPDGLNNHVFLGDTEYVYRANRTGP